LKRRKDLVFSIREKNNKEEIDEEEKTFLSGTHTCSGRGSFGDGAAPFSSSGSGF
jgi:hypothetical protein